MYVVHQIDDKVLFEIPQEVLGREILLVSRRAGTPTDFGYGGMKNNTQTLRWQKNQKKVLLRIVSHENVAADSLPICETVLRNGGRSDPAPALLRMDYLTLTSTFLGLASSTLESVTNSTPLSISASTPSGLTDWGRLNDRLKRSVERSRQ